MREIAPDNGKRSWEAVAPRERILALDALRGFAVHGLLAANIVLFAFPTARATSMEGWSGLDAALRVTVGALIEGKFYTLFSILFGVGLSMQTARAAAAGRSFGAFWLRRMAALAATGRMSLSNYVVQSILCAAIFNGWGLGLFNALSYAEALLMVVLVYVLQVILSSAWLSRFRYGPLEWLWRCASYRSRQPLMN